MSIIKNDDLQALNFFIKLPVRIDAINYGGHLAHDKLVTMMHEARLQFLANIGQSEMEFYDYSLITAKLEVDYKAQAFYGDDLYFYISVKELSKSSFTLFYNICKLSNEQLVISSTDNVKTVVALASTKMFCFDYKKQKVMRIRDNAIIELGKFVIA